MTIIYMLDVNQEVVDILPTNDILELWQDMGINEVDTLRETLKLNREIKDVFDASLYVGISDMIEKHSFNIYKISNVKMTNDEIIFVGIQLGFYELSGKGYIRDYRPTNRSYSDVMDKLLEGSGWRRGYTDANLPSVNTNFYYQTRLDSISKLVNLTGAEIKFKVSISNNKVTDKYIESYVRMGKDSGKRFVYGTNSLDIVAEEDGLEIYTAILGRGRGEEVSSAEDNESGQAGYGRKITFADVEWKKSDGDPVDKPIGQEYVELPDATSRFGYTDGSSRMLIQDYPDETDPENLLRLAYEDLLVHSRPKVHFKTTVGNVGELNEGDVVSIIRHDLNIKYQARVFRVKYNRIEFGESEMEIGDSILQSQAKMQANLTNQVRSIQDNQMIQNSALNIVSASLDGKNTNNFGNEEPDEKRVGDTWWRNHPNFPLEHQILVWNGNEWIINYDSSESTMITTDIDYILEQIDSFSGEIDGIRDSFEGNKSDIDSLQNQIRDLQSIISDRGSPLRVATFNIWGSRINFEQYKNFAISNRLDIIGMQEVLETSPDQLKTYGLNNVKYEGSWYNYGNAIQSRFDLVELEVFELPAESNGRRILIKTSVEFEGKTISVYNTHLNSQVDDTARLQQLEFIKQTMDADTNNYKILIGDFNVQEKAHYNIFGNLKSAQGHDGVWHDTWDVNIEPWNNGAIDNILVTPNIDILKVEMPLDKLGSDHYMLWAEIALR